MVGLLAAAAVAEVPVPFREVYETTDRNFLLLVTAVVDRVITLKSDTMRKAEKGA